MSDCVLMPVYNEEATVANVLDAVRGYYEGEVIVVDDGSSDETPRILAQRDDVTVIHLDRNCGYGCALRIGFDVARQMGVAKLITMDVDGQHEPAHIPEFFRVLEEGWDVVSGSRYLPQSASTGEAPAERRRVNLTVTDMINSVTGWGLTDAFCGFKAYRLEALAGMELEECGYAMPLELWAKAWRRGLSVVEIPVERIYCDHDRSFGAELDDAEHRLAYYLDVWTKAMGEAT